MVERVEPRSLAEDRHAHVELWWSEVRDEARREPLAQAGLELVVIGGGAIAGQNQLPAALVEGVERVEELFLCLDLVGQELDVVHQQDVDSPEALTEGARVLLLKRADEVARELLHRGVADPQPVPVELHVVADRLKEM